MSREHDTIPELGPPTVVETDEGEKKATEATPEPKLDPSRAAQVDEMLDYLTHRRMPVMYREAATSDGDEGVRYHAQHAPAKRVDNLDTDPGLNVIVRESIRDKTPPMPMQTSSAAATTQPMLQAPPRPPTDTESGQHRTDPRWPPMDVAPTEPSRLEMTPVPAPTWGDTAKRLASERRERATVKLTPVRRKRRVAIVIGAGVGGLLLIILLAAVVARILDDAGSSVRPTASAATSASPAVPTTAASAADVAHSASMPASTATPSPEPSAKNPTLPVYGSGATPPPSARPVSAAGTSAVRTPASSSSARTGPKNTTPSNGVVPDQEKEN